MQLTRPPPLLSWGVHRARELRQRSTFPESLLWSHLRGGRLGGLKFRRQHPLPPFVLDFFCHEAMLAIELDGETHIGAGAKDDARTRKIESCGVKVIRFTNDDVLRDTEAVLLAIASAAGLDW